VPDALDKLEKIRREVTTFTEGTKDESTKAFLGLLRKREISP